MVSVYPNPFTSVIGIFMTTSGANVYTLELHDLAGRLVLSKEILSNGGFVNTELDLSDGNPECISIEFYKENEPCMAENL
ncbi:MAG: T9SS type A sorting domain-containing protein [Bacteroidetes bacterium]|nr:T9SS type A sorting domain-containing protein [Bacteroidota bacterium]